MLGNRAKPVRRSLGFVIVRDNRSKIGSAVIALSIAQAALLLYARSKALKFSNIADAVTSYPYKHTSLVSQLAVLIAVANVVSFVAYLRSDRMLYAGLFPWPLPTLVLVQLLIGACEIYYSFFTPATRNVPIFGYYASLYANTLVASTLLSVVMLFFYARAQLRPVFAHPLLSESATDSKYLEYPPTNDPVDDETLEPPVEASGFSKSWYSTLVSLWLNDILRRGTARRLEATGLCDLDEADMLSSPSWRRYLRHRKPGRSLLVTMLITFAPEMLIQAVLSLAIPILTFSDPFSCSAFYARSGDWATKTPSMTSHPDEKTIRDVYFDALDFLLVKLVTVALASLVMWISTHIYHLVSEILAAEMLSKTLRCRGKGMSVKKDSTDAALSAAQPAAYQKSDSSLVSDISTVANLAQQWATFYSVPLTVYFGFQYMDELGLVCFLVAVLYTVFLWPPLKHYSKVKGKADKLEAKRTDSIAELLESIMTVKLFGWESRFMEMVDERHEHQQLHTHKQISYSFRVGVVLLLAPTLALAITFATYAAASGGKLTAETVFPALMALRLTLHILPKLFKLLGQFIDGRAALGRINLYLGQPQVQDLEKRVAHSEHTTAAVGPDELGFEAADLEWESPSSDTKAADKSAAISKGLRIVDTLDIGEQTLLFLHMDAATPYLQVETSSVNESDTSIGCNSSERDDNDNDSDMARFSLKDIDVRFPHGALSIVAGPTGSGKSSLLSALIGEMTLTRGRILLPTVDSRQVDSSDYKYRDIIELSDEGLAIRDIAYVAQEAWLRNATIRENILFGETYDHQRYEEVLRVCALKPDLRILSAGDQTETGARGVTLSGGQKQRVALARAVYSSRRILLIDDCLSAVDAHTAKHILTECLLSKTPLMLGRTRVLATHHVSMCLPYAQYIVMLREGQVSLKGNPSELQEQGGAFTKVLTELENSEDKSKALDKGKSAEEAVLDADVLDAEYLSKSANDSTSENEYNLRRLKKIAEQRGLDPGGDLSALEGSLVEDEERETGYVKSEVWLTYLNACGSKWFWIWLCYLPFTRCHRFSKATGFESG
ncbi:hypothetical protein IWW38_000661 [Coemansia aciculifera]|uniref:Uncharacterized protein n=1 Tax=Coemansia aciculifera TaxID=417176 RepID=A0ACC1M932_9FUNG|nr:hypothetical protein IWW38_000661 [Coemansia aciculifera]